NTHSGPSTMLVSTDSKFTADGIASHLGEICDFKGIEFNPEVISYIAERQNGIRKLEREISRSLIERGVIDSPIKIRIGCELEIYNIAGKNSFVKRLGQLLLANAAEALGGDFELH